MNLYRISQTENLGWDTYDSAIVAAADEEQARCSSPDGSVWVNEMQWWGDLDGIESNCKWTWCASIKHVKVELIGQAKDGTEPGVILASFNAG